MTGAKPPLANRSWAPPRLDTPLPSTYHRPVTPEPPPGPALDLAALNQRLHTRFIGHPFHYYASLPSTMDAAQQGAQAGAPEGATYFAEEQTAGRGRLGRRWVTPPSSSLALSIILRPPLERLPRLTLIGALAAALGIEQATALRPAIKWPNDVRLRERKVAGILVDSSLQAGGGQGPSTSPFDSAQGRSGQAQGYAIVGIGLNVNFDPEAEPDIAAVATSLSRELGHPIARETVLASLLEQLERWYLAPKEEALAAWRQRLETLGQRVVVQWRDVWEAGLAEATDDDGRLVLRRDDGSTVALAVGEVSLRSAT
ncbi:MAG: biotin--[acetyl-CoA-carboxylase] ligase [Dehalococcoidia bacterium]|nr:biotin--[acetyl-CoA-carboxylase] ligase [Dehalococcoidia bacterium]